MIDQIRMKTVYGLPCTVTWYMDNKGYVQIRGMTSDVDKQ